jgi:S-DNA-T family DNA segregation ATPase FtsK/SpoIIIE
MLNLKKNLFFKGYHHKAIDRERLNNLFYPLSVTDTIESPMTVQYRIKLNPDSKVDKLLKMRQNVCIALENDSVRLYRDKSELVIEIDGASNIVYLGDLYNKQFLEAKGLKIMLGIDADGHNLYTDLAKSPHILVAGTTGSGKSSFLQAAICSLLIKKAAEIYIVDPKVSEYEIYRGLNNVHLVTEIQGAVNMLQNLCIEMDNRYSMFNNIETANEAGMDWDYKVVIVDELADLMEQGGRKTIEPLLVRLASKARACGIHLILATQYPVVKYVTGALKANIPTRIAFAVNTINDSRVILDRMGAERLRGHGDMLFKSQKSINPIRLQGCFVPQDDQIRIVNTVKPIETIEKPVIKTIEKPATFWGNIWRKLWAVM